MPVFRRRIDSIVFIQFFDGYSFQFNDFLAFEVVRHHLDGALEMRVIELRSASHPTHK